MKHATCTDEGYEALVDEICSGPKPAPVWFAPDPLPCSKEYREFVERMLYDHNELKAFYVQLAAQQEILHFRTRFVHHPAFRWPDLESAAAGTPETFLVFGGVDLRSDYERFCSFDWVPTHGWFCTVTNSRWTNTDFRAMSPDERLRYAKQLKDIPIGRPV